MTSSRLAVLNCILRNEKVTGNFSLQQGKKKQINVCTTIGSEDEISPNSMLSSGRGCAKRKKVTKHSLSSQLVNNKKVPGYSPGL